MDKGFDKIIGFADFHDVNYQKLKYKIDVIQKILQNRNVKNNFKNILVAGCGDGAEAREIKRSFQTKVIGVDVSLEADIKGEDNFILLKQDLGNLNFQKDYFDFIYSYHVLEHVSEPELVLRELNRVLQKGKFLFIGFPNKNRLVGYIGAHNNVTFQQKICWNLKDYYDRIRGKFENKYGAHAGFTEKEFIIMSKHIFSKVIPVRNDYMELKYSNYNQIIKLFILSKFSEFIFPSNYYICIK